MWVEFHVIMKYKTFTNNYFHHFGCKRSNYGSTQRGGESLTAQTLVVFIKKIVFILPGSTLEYADH